jgi:hypothetical protein
LQPTARARNYDPEELKLVVERARRIGSDYGTAPGQTKTRGA